MQPIGSTSIIQALQPQQAALNQAESLTINRIREAIESAAQGRLIDFKAASPHFVSNWVHRAGITGLRKVLGNRIPDLYQHELDSLQTTMGGVPYGRRNQGKPYWPGRIHTDGGSLQLIELRNGAEVIVSTLDLWDLRIACVRHGLGARLGLVEA